MRILIIEDDAAKLNDIVSKLLAISGVVHSMISHAYDAAAGRELLAHQHFDLLVLDLTIPDSVGAMPDVQSGLTLIDELYATERYALPDYIIGVTAHSTAFTSSLSTFHSRGLSLVQYEAASDDWAEPLRARVTHILRANSAPRLVPDYDYGLFICCALRDPELEAIRQLEWDWQLHSEPGDDSIYYRGTFESGGRKHKVVAGAASTMGMPAAAVLATKGIIAFRPRYIAMPGITAGVQGKTRLGDILVGDPCWDYGSGKWTVEKGVARFHQAPKQMHLNPGVRSAIERLQDDKTSLFEIKRKWAAPKPDHDLSVHIGPLSSGSAVVADGQTIARVREQHRGLLGIEMEAFAIYLAAEEAPLPRPKPFAMKAVVDFGNPRKADEWQAYASYASARALQRLAEQYLRFEE